MAKFYDWPDQWYDELFSIARSKELIAIENAQCSDGWDGLDYWLSRYVRTHDEHDKENPFKPFPYIHKPYLREIAYAWYYQKDPLFIVKSRQIMVSWIICACYTWDSLFNKGRTSGIQSKKEKDADYLLARCQVIYDKLPIWMKQKGMKPKSYCKMVFPKTNSIIIALAQGADQVRGNVFSNLLMDEMAFQDKAEASYGAAKPTIDGGGRFTGISTANRSFFEMVVTDQIESEAA